MKEQEGTIKSIKTKLRGSQKYPGGLPFKLAGRQHVYQINDIKTGEEYAQTYLQQWKRKEL